MSPIENLYYAIGELAYAMAMADGKVQREERKKLLDMIAGDLAGEGDNAVVTGIIFRLLEKQEVFDTASAYDMAMKTIRTNSHYLSPALKGRSIKLLEKIAEAYPPFSAEETKLIERYKRDIGPINGDPVYYSPH